MSNMCMCNMPEICCNINAVRLQLVSVSESRGCTLMLRSPALVTVYCLVFRMDVPGFQYTYLTVVRMEGNYFCFFPINLMHLVNCMLCCHWLGCDPWCQCSLVLLRAVYHSPAHLVNVHFRTWTTQHCICACSDTNIISILVSLLLLSFLSSSHMKAAIAYPHWYHLV